MQFRDLLLAVGLLTGACDSAPDQRIAPASEFRCATDTGAFVIGLSQITVCGNVEVVGGGSVDIFSNDLIHLSGSYYLAGNAVVATGGVFEVSRGGNSTVGDLISGAAPLSVEPAFAEAEAAAANNNNGLLIATKKGVPFVPIANGTLTLSGKSTLTVPAGDYYFPGGINMSGQATLLLLGPTRFFVDGEVKISGTTKTTGSGSAALELLSISDETIQLAGTSDARLHISAPLAEVKITGTVEFIGSILADVVTITGTAKIGAGGDASNYGQSCEPPSGDDGLPSGDDSPYDPDPEPDPKQPDE